MKKSKVFFAPLPDGASAAEQAAALGRVMEATGFVKRLKKLDMVAIKLHVGERNNTTHVKPELAAAVALVKKAKAQAFLTDTSTLYKGKRENAIKHALHANEHGFTVEVTGAPFIALDGLSGTDEVELEVGGELHQRVKVAGQVLLVDALVVISHATGHIATGLGAAIKNVGMGLSSRAGKMRQHSKITPEVIVKKCTDCGKCRKWCPTQAISAAEGASFIDRGKCIGCGECIAVCRFGAIKFDYRIESPVLQKSMAEHAAAVVRRFADKAVYVNVLADMTKDCDCFDIAQKKIVPDVGVLASTDIVAADQATLDLTAKAHGKDLSRISYPRYDPTIQIVHAEKMGLGTREYLIEQMS